MPAVNRPIGVSQALLTWRSAVVLRGFVVVIAVVIVAVPWFKKVLSLVNLYEIKRP